MINGITDHTEFVYHYTKIATALNDILKDRTLLLGEYATTNDPKESKAWEFGLVTFENRDIGAYPHSKLSAWFSHELKSRTRLACFSKDHPPLTGNHMTDILNRGYAKPRMWAQYSEKHTGVCLVFRRSKLIAAAKASLRGEWLMHGDVTYKNRGILDKNDRPEFMLNVDMYESLGPKAYARSHIQTNHHSLFFEKLEDWRNEDEWRIVAIAESAEPLLLPIESALVGVIHGDATDPDVSEELIRATHGLGVEHMGLSWTNSAPWYDYGSFNWQPGKVTSPRRKRQ
jgi:hypothetical protein